MDDGGVNYDVVEEVLQAHPELRARVRRCEETRVHLARTFQELFLEQNAMRARLLLRDFHARLDEAVHDHGNVMMVLRTLVVMHTPGPVRISPEQAAHFGDLCKAPAPAESEVMLRVPETRVSEGAPPPRTPEDSPGGGSGGKP